MPNNLTQEVCKCGWIKLSTKEFERRQAEWDNYYEMVRSSKSFADARQIAQLSKGIGKGVSPADIASIKEIIKTSVSTRCNPVEQRYLDDPMYTFKTDEYMPKPNFPDPVRFRNYFVVE